MGGGTNASRPGCAPPSCVSRASIEDVDYRAARGLDRALFQKLSEGDWIDAHDNLALVGPSGVGKSWLACAIGQKACRDNRGPSSIIAWPKLACEDLAASPEATAAIRASSNPSPAPICSFSTTSASNPSTPVARHDLLEILEERYSPPVGGHVHLPAPPVHLA